MSIMEWVVGMIHVALRWCEQKGQRHKECMAGRDVALSLLPSLRKWLNENEEKELCDWVLNDCYKLPSKVEDFIEDSRLHRLGAAAEAMQAAVFILQKFENNKDSYLMCLRGDDPESYQDQKLKIEEEWNQCISSVKSAVAVMEGFFNDGKPER
ncbi:hypothetical protein AGMMS49543_19680 [Betaproteobacteria bacterium]|nr:hypothetical protein AGMMS49543_19680 [Betaproteobacteria bacterium]GHU17525.1 hypothetical protein AGMMS50243_05870 [Betaproteobacteria bacterium]